MLDGRLAAARRAASTLVPPVTDPMAARALIGELRAEIRALAGGTALLPVLWTLPAASLADMVAVGHANRFHVGPIRHAADLHHGRRRPQPVEADVGGVLRQADVVAGPV